jgi:hypothetical protein
LSRQWIFFFEETTKGKKVAGRSVFEGGVGVVAVCIILIVGAIIVVAGGIAVAVGVLDRQTYQGGN